MTNLRFWNTATRSLETFTPIDRHNIRVYQCGPTVYDRAHIGNARPAVVFDVLLRLLQEVYGQDCVRFVRNITDIDDKINARAAQLKDEGKSGSILEIVRRLTDRTIAWYHEDMGALGVCRPDEEPRATDYITEMIDMIQQLVDNANAYVIEGHVLFDVDSYPQYGAFARRKPREMLAGARVEVAPLKRNPLDFVLWKPSAAGLPGWDSPWGVGRPGWHIECSAMSRSLLGPTFDIHAGGIDLAFPHHENEIAQSRCADRSAEFARLWMHNGLLLVDGRKMSKSLGNFFTVSDLLNQQIPGEVLRFVLLSCHYRRPLDWTAKRIAQSRSVLKRWRTVAEGVEPAAKVDAEVLAALGDDLNTSRAIARLHELANSSQGAALKASAGLLGLLTENLGGWERPAHAGREVADVVNQLLQHRELARRKRDYQKADAIRRHMTEAGVIVTDSSGGTEWKLSDKFDPKRLKADAI